MTINERASYCMGGHSSRTYLFCLLTITPILFLSSWFLVLRSTGHGQFIDHNILPNSKLNAVIDRLNPSSNAQSRGLDSSVVEASDVTLSTQEDEKQDFVICDPRKALKVFMYDIPPQFHFGLLDWEEEGRIWPDIRSNIPAYPGGLNLQHSIEYWLTLDLLSSRFRDRPGPCSAVRVDNSDDADLVFVPFFSSLCYNRFAKAVPPQKSKNKILQEQLVAFLMKQKEWQRSGGKDHVILAHHPNSMLDARMALWPAIFVLADFGRYPPHIANVEKDVIAPYKHMIRTLSNDSLGFDYRPTLLYFQGAIYRKDVSGRTSIHFFTSCLLFVLLLYIFSIILGSFLIPLECWFICDRSMCTMQRKI